MLATGYLALCSLMTSCKSDKSAKGASSLNFISAVKDKRVKHIKCTCINLNKQEKDNMVSCEKALISVVIELNDKEQERKKTFKQDLTCQKHGFWRPTATTWYVVVGLLS